MSVPAGSRPPDRTDSHGHRPCNTLTSTNLKADLPPAPTARRTGICGPRWDRLRFRHEPRRHAETCAMALCTLALCAADGPQAGSGRIRGSVRGVRHRRRIRGLGCHVRPTGLVCLQACYEAALSVTWLLGGNDAGIPMLDERTGGCSDALSRTSRSRDQGAESTLAMIPVPQQGRRLGTAAAR
jgi:hypothetical protein